MNTMSNIEIGQKAANLNISPQMKKRLKPITDNASLMQLTQAKRRYTLPCISATHPVSHLSRCVSRTPRVR